LQAALVAWFFTRERKWNIRVLPEQRIQVKATRFRVPDVVVVDRTQPEEQILTQAPLIVIEVLSPQDTWARMEERIGDYLEFGVPNVWVLEPSTRRAWMATGKGYELTTILKVAGTPIAVPLEELFEEL
jgi:Uma2 family endonuclease